jgi:hypothetical protein
VYLRARFYAPSMGRFLTRDTWAGDYDIPLSLNRWNYVLSNPINFTDPSGHDYQPPQICLLGLDPKTGKCKNLPLPPFLSTVVGGTPTVGGYDTLLKLGLVACAYSILLATEHVDIDFDIRNSHIFYYNELGPYTESQSRTTKSIARDLDYLTWIEGIRGMKNQLENEDFLVYNSGQSWRKPFLMGRKFEAERAIEFAVRGALVMVNSTAPGYDLQVTNFGTIEFVQVKWAPLTISRASLSKFLTQVTSFPSGTMLLETTNIAPFDKTYLERNGGHELPYPYP